MTMLVILHTHWTDSSVVFGMGPCTLREERRCLHPATSSRRHVSGCARRRGNGCRTWSGGWIQHPIWRLHIVKDYS